MQETWLLFRRGIIRRRVRDESFIPQVEAELMGREDYRLAYGFWREGDRTTAGQFIARELDRMGYEEVK